MEIISVVIGVVIGGFTIVVAICSVTIANSITHAAETIAKAIKEKK